MDFRIEQRLAASLEAVEAALIDPHFLTSLGGLPKLGHPALLDQRVEGEVVHQRVRYAFVGDLSGAVRAVVDPERLTWVEDSVVDRRTHHTHFRIHPDHYGHLLKASGDVQLAQNGTGCLRRARGAVKVAVPLVGRKVEGAIISGLTEHARLEAAALEQWLAER